MINHAQMTDEILQNLAVQDVKDFLEELQNLRGEINEEVQTEKRLGKLEILNYVTFKLAKIVRN